MESTLQPEQTLSQGGIPKNEGFLVRQPFYHSQLLHKRPFLPKHHSFFEVRKHTGSSVTKLSFPSISQKRSKLREPNEQYPISP